MLHALRNDYSLTFQDDTILHCKFILVRRCAGSCFTESGHPSTIKYRSVDISSSFFFLAVADYACHS